MTDVTQIRHALVVRDLKREEEDLEEDQLK